jgi:hypothetical protein
MSTSTERSAHVGSHRENCQTPGLRGFFESRWVGHSTASTGMEGQASTPTESRAFGKALESFAVATSPRTTTAKEGLFDFIKRKISEFLDGIGNRQVKGAYELRDAINEKKSDKIREILSENSFLKEEMHKLITGNDALASAILFYSGSSDLEEANIVATFRDVFKLGTPDEYRRYMADQCLKPLKNRDTALKTSTDGKSVLDAVADAREALRKVEPLEAEVSREAPLSDAAQTEARNAQQALETAQGRHRSEIGKLGERETNLSREIEELERKIIRFERDKVNFPDLIKGLKRKRNKYSTELAKVKSEIEELHKQIGVSGSSDDKISIDQLKASIDALKHTMEHQAASLGRLLSDLRGTDELFNEGRLLEKKANAEQISRQANIDVTSLAGEIDALEIGINLATNGGLDQKTVEQLRAELEEKNILLDSRLSVQDVLAEEITTLNGLIANAKQIKILQPKHKKLLLERAAQDLQTQISKTGRQIETATQEQKSRPSPETLRTEKTTKEAELGPLRSSIASKEAEFAAEEEKLRNELNEKSANFERLQRELQTKRDELGTAKTELKSAVDSLRNAYKNVPSSVATLPEEWISKSEKNIIGATVVVERASPMLAQVSRSPAAIEHLANQLAQLSGAGDVLECISKLFPITGNSEFQNMLYTVFEKICQPAVDVEIRQESNATALKQKAVNRMADLLMAFKNVNEAGVLQGNTEVFDSLERKYFTTTLSKESELRKEIFMEAKRITQEINKLVDANSPVA